MAVLSVSFRMTLELCVARLLNVEGTEYAALRGSGAQGQCRVGEVTPFLISGVCLSESKGSSCKGKCETMSLPGTLDVAC